MALFSDNQIRAGKFEAKPAIIAPKPRLTKSAGSAQHIKVLKEVKRLKKGKSFLLYIICAQFFRRCNRNQLEFLKLYYLEELHFLLFSNGLIFFQG